MVTKCSRTLVDSLHARVARRRRAKASREMRALSAHLPKVSVAEVAKWIRDERGRGH